MAKSGETSASGAPPPLELQDPEFALAGRRRGLDPDGLDRRQRRRLRRQAGEQLVDRAGLSLDLEHHPALVVEHPPPERELGGEPVDEGPEADALDGAGDVRPHAPPGERRPGGGSGGLGHRSYPESSISSRSTWYAEAWASWIRGMCCERVTITWSASRSPAIRPPS